MNAGVINMSLQKKGHLCTHNNNSSFVFCKKCAFFSTLRVEINGQPPPPWILSPSQTWGLHTRPWCSANHLWRIKCFCVTHKMIIFFSNFKFIFKRVGQNTEGGYLPTFMGGKIFWRGKGNYYYPPTSRLIHPWYVYTIST
jgi:hypothetical protein